MKKLIAILGAGESGVGAALLAKREGYVVWVSDLGTISPSRKSMLVDAGIPFEEGHHSEEKILAADEIIKSPGIPDKAPLVKKAREAGIPVIDELEFAFRYSKGNVIAITGTNGKTTTTLLTYHLLQKGGLDVGLGGNVGESWAGQLVNGDRKWWVLETSSFQIDGFREFKPKIAILTNITPDHLDRYEYTLDKYVASKVSLFKNMEADDAAIYWEDDALVMSGMGKASLRATCYPVSLAYQPREGGYFDGQSVNLSIGEKNIQLHQDKIVLKGTHNMLNTMFAASAAVLAGVPEDAIMEGVGDFKNAAHRMESLGIVRGVSFVNDSKGTNVDATAYALASYGQPIIWIAGGIDKGNDYSVLYPTTDKQVKMLICLGVDNEKLKKAFSGRIPKILETQSIYQAASWGLEFGASGDVVLLSPACASFDLFKNYEDRGDQFRAAVEAIKSGES